MNKKLWKRIAAFVMTCAVATSTALPDTALAASNGNKKNATLQQKPTPKTTVENNNTKNLQSHENSPELSSILEECEVVGRDSSKIEKGQMLSVSSVSNISKNENTCMAIMSNGDLYCWGYNYWGEVGNGTTTDQLVPVKILEKVDSVFFENETSAAITDNGDLYCWGYNSLGNVGNGTTDKQLTPVKVLENVFSVSLTDYNSAAITNNGDLYRWGHNHYGQVGNGTTDKQLTPVKVLENVLSVSVTDYNSVAITDNGNLYCWGINRSGQVGNGTTEPQLTPIKVLGDVSSVSVFNFSSYSHGYVNMMAAITNNGDLYCWGWNTSGQVGNGTTELQLTPIKVLENVRTVTAASYGSRGDGVGNVSAVTTNGDLYCWGWNTSGQVGNGTTVTQLTPEKILDNVNSVSVSASVSVVSGDVQSYNYRTGNMAAITVNGDLYCWGANRSGQVGNGTISQAQCSPEKVLSNVNFVSVSSGGDGSVAYRGFGNTVAIATNGDLYCWGANGSGQIGNNTTETQSTPERVLSNISSVSFFSSSSNFTFGGVSAITTNGDLYCWGTNRVGQVGNGTTINQLTPLKILGSPNKNGCLQIPDSITLEKGKYKYITGKIFADNLDKLKEMSNSLVWSSANPSVATVESRGYLVPADGNVKDTVFVAKVTSVSRGETDIFVSAPDGSKACCHVVVSKPTEAEEPPWETDYNDCFSIAGELQEVDSTNGTIKIDGVAYKAFSDSILTDAKNILEQHENKIVACKVRETHNEIMRIDDVKDIEIKPSVSIEPEIRDITYENGKFSKKSFKVDLLMHCTTDFGNPYTISDISVVANRVDGLEIAFSKLSLTTSYDGTGTYAFLLKDGLFASQEKTLEKKLDFKLKPGQVKKISVTAYVKEDSFPKDNVNGVNAKACIEAKINDEKERVSSYSINLSNIDKSREKEQQKLAASPKSTELKKASNILNGIQVAYTELDLKKCLTNTEVQAISAQVYNWIYTLNALNVIINDDSDSSVLKKLMKKFGLTKEALQNKVLKKMGIDKNVIPWIDSYTGTLQFEAKDKNTGKKITIKFTADMSLYTLGGLSYAGCGTLKYKISSGGSGQGQIAYTNLDNFIESLKKVVDSQMHNCFNKIYADGINEIFNESVADSLISSTFGKLVNEKYGSASEAVYTGLKYAFTGYTEEDAKKSVKDIVIILSREVVNRYTKISDRCPVDVTVYDGDGNICAEIKDDVVDEKYQDVAAYVEGEDKYLLLPDADYIICYSGNDIGTMDYTVTEYENGEAVRELIYNDVPLTAEKKYVNYLISGRHQGISLYNLNQVDGGIVEATSDIDKTKEQDISAKSITLNDKTLSLKKGENYILMETISPDDVSTYDITWSSSNDDVVEVSSSGVLYAKADGEAVITVKINGRNLSDSCKVTVVEGNVSSPTPDASLAPEPTRIPDNPYTPYMPIIIPGSVPTGTPASSVAPSVLPTLAPSEETSDMPSDTPEVTPSGKPAITPEPSIVPQPSSTPKPDNKKNLAKSLKKGAMVSDSKTKAVYKITGTGKSKTVEYVRSTRKNASKITIPAKVKLKGQNYKVTAIAKNALKNNKKLSYLTIGKNVKTIGKKAFYGCKKLRYIYVKSKKLTENNIGGQAFGRGYHSPRVKTAKSIWKQYSNVFLLRGMSKKALFVINPVKLVI